MARKPKPPAKDLIISDVAGEIERLRAALTVCLDYIEGDEVAHGRTYRAGREARTVLKREPPAELEECVD